MLTVADRKNPETLFNSASGFDTRKVLNRAPNVAGLTRAQLEEGVTLEALEALPVPVFKYQTQITVHGIFPPEPPRAGGYKSLITNQNGSLGVRYIAIDAGKKRIVSRAVRLAETPWTVCADSRGYALEAIRKTSQEALQELRGLLETVPGNLFIGNKTVCRYNSMYGDFLVASMDINAIRAEHLAGLVRAVTGGQIPDLETLERLRAEEKAREAEEHAKFKAECDAEQAEQARKDEANRAMLDDAVKRSGLVVVNPPQYGKRYILPGLFGFGHKPGFAVVEYGKAFGRTIRKGKVFPTLPEALQNLNCDLGKGREKELKPVYRVA